MRPSDHLLEFGRPVAYYPGLVKHLGSVNAVLMFCQFFYWSSRTECELGVYKSVEEIEAETGLTYREQATARKKLVEKGVLIETNKRLEHRIYYRIDRDRLDEILSSANCATSTPRNADSAVRGETKTQFVHTETTTETTTEITNVSEKAPGDDVREVFEFWKTTMGKNASTVLDANRRGRIEWALKNYGMDGARKAIIGCSASPWHMGQNPDGKRHNDLTLIFRNAAKAEGFIDGADKPAQPDGRSAMRQPGRPATRHTNLAAPDPSKWTPDPSDPSGYTSLL